MKIHRLALLFLLSVRAVPAISVETPNSCLASVSLPETVELALIIAGISQLARDNNNAIDRTGSYFADVEAYFAAHSEHPVFAALGADFNLPRLAGNAADFGFDENDRLVEVDSSGSLWHDAENDLFRRYLPLIADFANVSRFREFYSDHQSAYRELVDRTDAASDIERMRCWLESQFTTVPGGSRVYVSPLMANFHWTTLYKPEHRLWVSSAPLQTVDDELTRMRYARVIFTELDHPFVNPVTAQYKQAVEAAFEQSETWVTDNARSNYPSGELQFNEYMTFAVFLMFAADHLSPADFARLREEVISMMAERRGFLAFEAFNDEALRRYRHDGVITETLIPSMIRWCATYDKN